MFPTSILFLLVTIAESVAGKVNPDCVNGNRCRVSTNYLRWFSLGDWGGLPVWPYYSYAESTVGKTMGKLAMERHTHFQLALGDNFYFTGVKDEFDDRFESTFENIFKGEALQTPWYITSGNHDHYGNVSGQIAYSAHSNRWVYPNFTYTVNYELSDGTTVDLVFIDTIQLCGNTKDLTFTNVLEYLETRSFEPQGPKDAALATAQWAWLEETLAASEAAYLFVVGHYPVYSVAEHGPIPCLVDRLRPLLFRHGVSAYISGHDHTLQHLKEEEGGHTVHYLLSGAGAFIDSSTKHINDVPEDSLVFRYPESKSRLIGKLGLTRGGLMYTSLNASAAQFSFLRGDGRNLHSFSIPPRTL